MDTSCRLSSPTQVLAICQNIYERMYTCASQWLNGNSCQGQHQTALTAGHFGNSLWVTLSVRGGGSKRSTVVGWPPATHLIVGILRYVSESSFGGIRLGTALVRVRRSLHTMLLTISNSEPVSTGWLLLTVFVQLTLHIHFHHHNLRFHMLILTSESLWKLPQRSKPFKVQKILHQKRNLQS